MYVGEGLQNETPGGRARVGEKNRAFADPQAAGINDVEIQRPGLVASGRVSASEEPFQPVQHAEEGGWLEVGLDFHDRIEEWRRAGSASDGFGLIERRHRRAAGAGMKGEQEIPPGPHVRGTITQIGAESHAGLHPTIIPAPEPPPNLKLPRWFAIGVPACYLNGFMRFAAILIFAFVPVLSALALSDDEDASPYREMKTLARAMELVRQDYVDEDKAGYQDLAYNALRGMISELDPHSDFMDPKDFKGMQEDTKSEFGGLGVVVGMKKDFLTIVAPMEGTPGFRAGLLPGDVLLEIDGKTAKKMSMRDAVEKLRGEPGTAVVLTIGREGQTQPMKFEIIREVIRVPSVRGARILDGPKDAPRIGYVRVTQFSEPTSKEFARALSSLEKQGMDALVLDLRFNPGGLLSSAIEVAGEFLPGGALVAYTEGRSPTAGRSYFVPEKNHEPRAYPLALLVNSSSASGAEIVAGALKDSGRALLVGETTFGKGSVQSVVSLSDGSALRLTTAKYFTPGRQLIHERGVAPHLVAPMTAAAEAALLAARRREELPADEKRAALSPPVDIQLRRAVDALRGMLMYEQEGAAKPLKRE